MKNFPYNNSLPSTLQSDASYFEYQLHTTWDTRQWDGEKSERIILQAHGMKKVMGLRCLVTQQVQIVWGKTYQRIVS
jgi:hypothetical protein